MFFVNPFLLLGYATLIFSAEAVGVTGAAEGFAKGVTGGGSATPVYPTTNAELVSYLGDSSARVIILTKTFDFTGSEGTVTETGCAPWGTGSGCQTAINANSWCDSSYPLVSVTYDKAGTSSITVKSNKSIVGQGTAGIIKGKGLRVVDASNVIIQNIKITGLNPQYVWGGDALTLVGTDLVWIDHVTTSLVGRQHLVLGYDPSSRVTVSNCDFDGTTSWSPNCDSYHYWNILFLGEQDLVTFKNNYVHHFSGRAPKVGGNTLLHVVNNYFYQTDSNGHAFEIDSGGMVLAEGNVFQNVANVVTSDVAGQAFTSPDSGSNAACSTYLGRTCQVNAFGSSGTFNIKNTGFLANFSGKNIASATSADTAKTVISTAGYGKI